MPNLTVSAVPGSGDRLDVTWDEVDDAFIYSVWYKTGSQAYHHRRGVVVTVEEGRHPTSARINGLDPDTVYDVQVRVFDSGYWKLAHGEVTGTRTGAAASAPNSAPAFGAASYRFTLAENADGSATPVSVGTVSATDADAGDTLAYSIESGNTGNVFDISSSGAITYRGRGEDFESFATPARAYSLRVRASDGAAYTEATVTVGVTDVDDDAPGKPAATIAAGTSPVTEGTAAQFTVTLSSVAPAAGLTVNLTVSESANGDFVASADEGAKTLAIAGGATTGTYRVVTTGDGDDEPDGSVTVTLAGGTGYTLGTAKRASVTVRDDDRPQFRAAPQVFSGPQTFSGPSGASDSVLVSNHDETNANVAANLSQFDQALAFTTGSNPDGYRLTSVEFAGFSNATSVTVTVNSATGDQPGAVLGTLTGSSTAGARTYTHPGLDLTANTPYFVVVDIDTGILGVDVTASDAETGLAGWSLGDGNLYRNRGATSGTWLTWTNSFKLRINGTAKGTVIDEVPTFGTNTISNQSYTRNTQITPLTLPAATGGDGALNYELVGTLPAGLSYNANTRQITGTPTEAQSAVTYTWKVTDSDASDPDSDELTFTIAVSGTRPTLTLALSSSSISENGGSATVTASLSAAVSREVRITVKAASDPDHAGTELVEGTDFSFSTNKTLTIAAGATTSTGTVTITARNNDRVGVNKTLVVHAYPSDVSNSGLLTRKCDIGNFNGVANTQFVCAALTLTDDDGVTDLVPDFGSETVAAQSFPQLRAVDLTLPAATGGDGALIYSISPNPPAGLSFNPATRKLTGKPTTTQNATTYTYKVTDSDATNPDSDTLTFTIAVTANAVPSFPDGASIPDLVFAVNKYNRSTFFPLATGGDSPVTYSVKETLPTGLQFQNSNVWVVGTPTAVKSASTYTLVATDNNGDKAELTFSLEVVANATPTFGTGIDDLVLTKDSMMTPVTLPLATGGNAPLSHAISTLPLPTGLTVERSGGTYTLKGTPTARQVATSETWQAEDTDREKATVSFSITVIEGTAPSFGGSTIDDQSYTQNAQIAELTLPTASGGDGTVEYALVGTLPAGLSYDSTNRKITGTPTATQSAVSYIWRATDSHGDKAELTFTIAVAAPSNRAPAFGSASYSFTLAENADGSTNAVSVGTVSATDADTGDTVSYSITAGNTGSVFAISSTGAITYTGSGENYESFTDPADPASAFTLTVQASDGTATDTATVTVAVTDDNTEAPGKPAAPTVTPTASSTTSLDVTWTAPSNAGPAIASYDLRYREGTSGTWENGPQDQTGLTAKIPSLTAGTSYQVQVRATNDEGDSSWSDSGTGTTSTADAAQGIVLSKTALSVPVGKSITYTVKLKRAPGGGNTNEHVTVFAFQSQGSTTLSDKVSVSPSRLEYDATNWNVAQTVTVTAQPGAAAGDTASLRHALQAENTADHVWMTATLVANSSPAFGSSVSIDDQTYTQNSVISDLALPAATGGNGTVRYSLSPAPPAGLGFDAGTRMLTGTPTAAQSATTYTYTATDEDGDTATLEFDITVSSTTNTAPAFDAASYSFSLAENADGSTTAVSVGTVTATDADTGDSITYSITAGNTGSVFAIGASTGAITYTGSGENYESFTDPADPASAFTLTVRASDGTATDTATVTVAVTDVDTEAPGKPAAPTVGPTTGSSSSLDVEWTAPSNAGPAITGYDLRYREGTSGTWDDGPQDQTGLTAMIGSLDAGTSYQVQVRATNAEGDGAWSDSTSGTTSAALPAVPNLVVTPVMGATDKLDVSWDAVADTLNYVVRWKTGGQTYVNTRQIQTNPRPGDPQTSAQITGLTADTAYDVQVTVVASDHSVSARSEVAGTRTHAANSATIAAKTSPVTEGTAAVFTVTLTTAAPAAGLNFSISVADAPGSDFVAAADQGVKTVSFAAGETTKDYSVATVDDGNDETDGPVSVTLLSAPGYTLGSPSSAAVTVQDNDLPAIPNLTVAAVDGEPTKLDVDWDAPTGVTFDSYIIEWKSAGQSYDSSRQTTNRGPDPDTEVQLTGLTADTAYDVRVSAVDQLEAPQAQSEITGTLTGVLPTATIAAGTSPVTEGTDASFTVTLSSAAPASGLTIDLTVSEGVDDDYVASGNEGAKTLDIAGGATTGTYNVPTVDDGDDEANGTVTVTLNAGTGYTLGATTSTSVAVEDDDDAASVMPVWSATLTVGGTLQRGWSADTGIGSITSSSMTDQGATRALTGVFLVGSGLSIAYGDLTGSATGSYKFCVDGTAFTKTPGWNPFTGAASRVDWDPSGLTWTNGQKVELAVVAATQNCPAVTPPAVVTGIELSLSPSRIAEDGGARTVTATATLVGGTLATAADVILACGREGDTATYGTDLGIASAGKSCPTTFEFAIPAGAASGSIDLTVTPTNDTAEEGDERVYFRASVGGFPSAGAMLTVVDDDKTEFVPLPPRDPNRVPRNLAVSDTGVVTWTLDKATAPDGRIKYWVEWNWDEVAPSYMDLGFVNTGQATVHEFQCSEGRCETRIEDFDARYHYLVEVNNAERPIKGLPAAAARHTPAPGEVLNLTGVPENVAVSDTGLVTWSVPSVRDDYTVAWASGTKRLAKRKSRGARNKGFEIVDVRTCADDRCSLQIPNFDAARHWLVEVNALDRRHYNGREPVRVRHSPWSLDVTLAAGPAVDEGTAASFTVTLSEAAPEGGLTLAYGVSEDGEFVAADDEGAKTLAIDGGATSATIEVPTAGDDADEPDGSVTVTLDHGDGYNLGAASSAAVTVRDDDEAPAEPEPEPEPEPVSFTIYHDPDDGTAATGRYDTAVGLLDGAEWASYTVRTVTGSDKVDGLAGVSNSVLPRFFLGDPEEEGWGPARAKVNNGGLKWLRKKLAEPQKAREPQAAPGSLPGVSVADARVREAPGAVLAFRVTLDRAPDALASVDYRTVARTAHPRYDYTPTSGTLLFAPGETEKTVSVPVLDDAHDEGEEELLLVLSNPSGLRKVDGDAVGTITNTDPMPGAWLVRMGRTVGSQALDALGSRFAETGGSHGTLGGQAVTGGAASDGTSDGTAQGMALGAGAERPWWQYTGDRGLHGSDPHGGGTGLRTMTLEQFLLGTSFHLAASGRKEAGGPGFAAWGRFATTAFEGEAGGLDLDGTVTTGFLGADAEWDRLLAGVMVSHSLGEGTYGGPAGKGDVESALTGVWPYAKFDLTERVSVAGLAGAGWGRLTLKPEGERAMETDVRMRMAAVGVTGRLLDGEDGIALNVRSDAMWVGTESDAVPGMAASEGEATRLRLVLDGSRTFAVGGGATLTPSAEIGLRVDGGDAETGFGTEVGGGVAWSDPERGLSAEVKARGLLTHEDSGFSERGVSGGLTWDPRPDTERGPKLTLSQTLGATDAGGVDALLARDDLAGLAANDNSWDRRRFEARLGYGVPAFGGRLTGTPEVALGLSDTGRDYALGWRLTPERQGPRTFEFKVEALRNESVNDNTPPEHRIGFGFTARW